MIKPAVLAAAIAAMACAAPGIHAAEFPTRPITLIIGFAPGGPSDVMARVLSRRMEDILKQPLVIENRTGAGGNIGADIIAKSPPDGYSLVMGTIGTHAVNVSLFSKLPYDPVRDFVPVALVVEADGLLVLHPSVPAKTVKELISLARSRPGQLVYASPGNGTAGHLSGELFKSLAKIDLVHIPYKGNVPALTDLVGGQTSMLFATMPTAMPLARAGKLYAMAVTGAQRNPAAPELPALAETNRGCDRAGSCDAIATAGDRRDWSSNAVVAVSVAGRR